MEIANIDNSVTDDLSRVITWQYDNATRLIGFIYMLKAFYDSAVGGPWDRYMNYLFNLDDADDFGLSVWAATLGINRPTYVPVSTGEATPISDRYFRNILRGRMFMLKSNYSTKDICQFLKIVYNNRFKISDNLNCSITFSNTSGVETRYEEEDWLAANNSEFAFIRPAGVSMSYTAS